jgi:PAS domain S-box-containing protein
VGQTAHRDVRRLVGLGIGLLLWGALAAHSEGVAPQRVMLLVSYHAGMPWSDDQIAGVRSQLLPLAASVTLQLDFLDTKNVQPTPAYYQRQEDLLLTKYGRAPPTPMLATDDDALDFALRMRQRHYPGVPILFSGVAGSRKASLETQTAVAGVFDDVDVAHSLWMMLQLRPHTRRVVVIHDQSRTSLAQVATLREAAAQRPSLTLDFLSQMGVQDIQDRLRQLGPNDLVIALAFNRDANDRVLTHEEATDLWAKASQAPLAVTRDVSMRPGVLGGYLVTGRHQGETLGNMAVQVLRHTPIAQLPLLIGAAQPTFDYGQLQRWDIRPEALPSSAVIINRPPSTLESLRPHIAWLLALFGSMLVIIALLVNGIRTRRRSEIALRQSEQNYHQLFNSSTDAILVRDAATNTIVDTNLRFQSLYGYTNEEARQLTVVDLSLNIAPYTVAEFTQHTALTRDGTPQLFEWRSRRKDGSDFWSEVSMTRFELPEGLRLVSTVRDTTELKAAQHNLQELNQQLEARVQIRNQELQRAMGQLVQSEKLAALGSLVAGVAHELNTPIGNTLMASSTLKEDVVLFRNLLLSGNARRSDVTSGVERLQEASDLIERNALRAGKLITDFKQVAVDQSSSRRRLFNLREVIDGVVCTMAPLFKRTRHQIEIQVPDAIGMDSYPGPLEQVLTNLLTNSLHHGFAQQEDGVVQISACSKNDTAVLTYADNGCGIAESHQKHVFEPFYTTRLGQGGSGLGLYIVYNLVTDVLGGSLTLRSAPQQGTTFIMRLPLHAPERSEVS